MDHEKIENQFPEDGKIWIHETRKIEILIHASRKAMMSIYAS